MLLLLISLIEVFPGAFGWARILFSYRCGGFFAMIAISYTVLVVLQLLVGGVAVFRVYRLLLLLGVRWDFMVARWAHVMGRVKEGLLPSLAINHLEFVHRDVVRFRPLSCVILLALTPSFHARLRVLTRETPNVAIHLSFDCTRHLIGRLNETRCRLLHWVDCLIGGSAWRNRHSSPLALISRLKHLACYVQISAHLDCLWCLIYVWILNSNLEIQIVV